MYHLPSPRKAGIILWQAPLTSFTAALSSPDVLYYAAKPAAPSDAPASSTAVTSSKAARVGATLLPQGQLKVNRPPPTDTARALRGRLSVGTLALWTGSDEREGMPLPVSGRSVVSKLFSGKSYRDWIAQYSRAMKVNKLVLFAHVSTRAQMGSDLQC